MFHADRWTKAFFAVSGENAESIFLCLKAVSWQVKQVHGSFFGHRASANLEAILRESAASAEISESSPAVEFTIRFICLLIEKNCFKYINLLLARIEQILDERKGILNIIVESAVSLDGDFEKELARMIKERTGASEIKMETRIKPELLGGYLLRIGSFYVDASLKGQLEKLTAELNQAAKLIV